MLTANTERTEDTELMVSLNNIDCGCDSRREVMFTHGGLNARHVAALLAVAGTIYLIGRVAT